MMREETDQAGHQERLPERSFSFPGKPISRRAFLHTALAAAVLAGCRSSQPQATPGATSAAGSAGAATPQPSAAAPEPTAASSATATAPGPTAAVEPSVAAPAATAVRPPVAASRVAIARAKTYDRAPVRQQVRALLDGIGGLKDVVSSGDRVAIKVNLTSGSYFNPPAGLARTESYFTHPEVVRALGELLRDAGARQILIVEALYQKDSYRQSGYEEVAEALDATLVDLNDPQPYDDFASVPVGAGWFIYDEFALNHLLEEVDAFVSVAKMKSHCICGVTHSMKNLVGLVPASRYALNPSDWWRSALHGSASQIKARMPRVVIDLNRARPIDLALIDGIMTAQGGEVPRGSFAPVQPGVLLAGKNPVATDAVATAAMGFDPTAEYPAAPFVNADSFLNLAYKLGLGSNRLDEIQVVGAAIKDVAVKFAPCYSETGLRGEGPFGYA